MGLFAAPHRPQSHNSMFRDLQKLTSGACANVDYYSNTSTLRTSSRRFFNHFQREKNRLLGRG